MRDKREISIAFALGSIFLLVILVFAISSSDDDLDGSNWQMASLVVDGSMTPAVDGSAVTISFDDASVRGSGGCNDYSGDYTSEDGSLSFGDLVSTLMICEPETSDQEFVYLSHLGAVDALRIEGDRLILSEGATDLIVFDRVGG